MKSLPTTKVSIYELRELYEIANHMNDVTANFDDGETEPPMRADDEPFQDWYDVQDERDFIYRTY